MKKSAEDSGPLTRDDMMVLVPYLNGIDGECEQGLGHLEREGVCVIRGPGCSAIDVARNQMLSEALQQGVRAMLFIDSDIGFKAADALRLFERPEPVIAGVYAKKGAREMGSVFAEGTKEVVFGEDARAPYPLRYAAAGFLRIRAWALWRMIDQLKLPLCNTQWGKPVWPFFQPMIVPQGHGESHYLAEDWAFSQRCHDIDITPLADTSIRLFHWGRYGYTWEEAGASPVRYQTYSYRLE